jgi:hypothetical protein
VDITSLSRRQTDLALTLEHALPIQAAAAVFQHTHTHTHTHTSAAPRRRDCEGGGCRWKEQPGTASSRLSINLHQLQLQASQLSSSYSAHSLTPTPHGLLPTAPTRHSLSSKAIVLIHTLAGLIIPAAAVQDNHRPRARQSLNPPLAPTLHARPSLSRIATSWSQRGVTHHFIPKYLVCLPPLTLPFATPQHQRPALTTCYYLPAPCLPRQRS